MPLHIDKRPSKLEEVIGNEGIKESIRTVFAREDKPHSVLFTGSSGCIKGSTVIYDPTDNSELSVKERYELGKPFHVVSMTSDSDTVVTLALPPEKFSPDLLYRVETSESTFFVTNEHQFLSHTGEYHTLKELNDQGFSSFLLRSISESSLKAHIQDAPHCLKKEGDSLTYYQKDLRFCDVQLLPLTKDDLETLKEPNGALSHILKNCTLDDPSLPFSSILLSIHNQTDLLSSLPSKNHLLPEDSLLFSGKQFLTELKPCESFFQKDNNPLQAQIHGGPLNNLPESLNLNQTQAPNQLQESSPLLCVDTLPLAYKTPPSSFTFTSASINSITEDVNEEYYDFHVPIHNNYWCGGLFHHNCGKTTLARIAATLIGCVPDDVQEYNSSNTRGIDTIREIAQNCLYSPMSGKVKVYIIDECHRMTKDAQNALLKTLEDTPKHVFFFLCTTDPEQLIKAIRTRCMLFEVKQLNSMQLTKLLEDTIKSEGIPLEEFSKSVIKEITKAADGCPRQALILLDSVIDIIEEVDALRAISEATATETASIEVCKLLLETRPNRWDDMRFLLKGLGDDAEKMRYGILGYMAAVLISDTCKNTDHVSAVIDQFTESFMYTGKGGFYNACYNACKIKG